MKSFLALLLLVTSYTANSENLINWDGNYQLRFSDFQSAGTQIGNGAIYSVQSASSFSFSFAMTKGEFMFTKNFNGKVDCTFQKDAAALVAPDSATATSLLEFARYEFDLAELYARKFRKSLYEGKGAFSDVNFAHPLYETIQKEYVARHMTASQETDLGRNAEKLTALHQEVIAEIEQLADFCKSCKPAKKKKQA